MNPSCSRVHSTIGRAWGRLLLAPAACVLLALAACNGTAVVTLTSTASQDNFLAYRVGLVSVQLESSSGKSGLKILPSSTTVDLTTLAGVSEVLGAAAVTKGNYKSALLTLDYSAAQIVYDDGSLNGIALTPVGANGQALGQIQLTVNLDPSDSFSVSSKGSSRLSLNFSLAASNVVNLSAKTVTVTPVVAASALPIDGNPVRVRGPISGVTTGDLTSSSSGSFSMGIWPFNGSVAGAGKLSVVPSTSTTYEINGSASTGTAGEGLLASVGSGTLAVAYGTLTSAEQSTTTTTAGATTTTSSNEVTFTASQVLAGSSVQGAGFDRVTGTVSARNGDTLTVEDGTLVADDGVETFLGGTTFVIVGANTVVTEFGQGVAQFNTTQQITVGSSIDAFGAATIQSSGNATLDASAGRVRLDTTTASGLVTAQGTGALTVNLAFLDGRTSAPLDFAGTGAVPGAYSVTTGNLDLTNSTVGAPVIVTGLPGAFGAAPPVFTASTLLDPTTINAVLMVDWGAGTAAPFATFDSTAIDVDSRNSGLGARHQIQVGAQIIDIVGLASDPLIVPNSTSPNTVYCIAHMQSSTIQNFDTYDAFVTQLQAELNGSTLVTGLTAIGQYTASTFSLAATSITLSLNN
ncbi:MAG: hypothetical protein WA803_06115 [Steroidobacteraceae bacterium]